MRATFIFAWTQVKRFFRDPVALFFSLLFPLLFLFVFGSIFRGDTDLTFDVAIFNNSNSSFSEQFVENISKESTFSPVEVGSFDDAKDKMGRGEIDSILVMPTSFGEPGESGLPAGNLEVYYEESSPDTGKTVASIMDSILREVNQSITGQSPLFSVEQKATTTANLTQFDYLIAGLLGFSMLSMGIFGLAAQIPAEKKTGTLKRLRATPFSKAQLIFGTLIYYSLIGALSLVLMMTVALTVFGFDMRGDWLQLALFIAPCMAVNLGFGLLIGGWSKNENQAAILSNVIAFPMMFLSGVFIPRFVMPEWLQGVTDFLPLTPIVDGIRYIVTEGATLVDLGPQLALIGVYFVVIYALAIKTFRWD